MTCDKLDGRECMPWSITSYYITCQRNSKLMAQYKCPAAVSRISDNDDSIPQDLTGKKMGKAMQAFRTTVVAFCLDVQDVKLDEVNITESKYYTVINFI